MRAAGALILLAALAACAQRRAAGCASAMDSRPGSIARLELRREGALQSLEVPVE